MSKQFRVKYGVNQVGLQLKMRKVKAIISNIYYDHGKYCILTSALDGIHGIDSYHYHGYALDFRTYHLTGRQKTSIYKKSKYELSKVSAFYDVVLCRNCLHVEFDIDRSKNFPQLNKVR